MARIVSSSIARASPSLSSRVSVPARRFFALLRSFTGKRSARIGTLIGTFDIRAVTLDSSDTKWRQNGTWIILTPLENPPNLVRRGALRRGAANLADMATEFFRGNILDTGSCRRL